MYKIAKILAIVLGVLGVVLWVMVSRADDPNNSTTDLMLTLGEWMTYIAAGVTLIYSILNLVAHPEKLKRALISVGAFAVVLLISYFALAKSDPIGDATEGTSKMVDAGLWTFYILTLVAVLAMIVSGFEKVR